MSTENERDARAELNHLLHLLARARPMTEPRAAPQGEREALAKAWREEVEELRKDFVQAYEHFRAGKPLAPLSKDYMEGAADAWQTAIQQIDRLARAAAKEGEQ